MNYDLKPISQNLFNQETKSTDDPRICGSVLLRAVAKALQGGLSSRCNIASSSIARKGFTTEMFLSSEQKVSGSTEIIWRLLVCSGILWCCWSIYLLDQSSILLYRIWYILVVLVSSTRMWVRSSSIARVFVQAGWQTMPACFDCRLLKCYFGGCVTMLECDSVGKTRKGFKGVSCRSPLSSTRLWVKGCTASHSYSMCTLLKHSSSNLSG